MQDEAGAKAGYRQRIMKMFPAKAQRRKVVLGFYFAPLRLCAGKLVALAIALSFFATLVPIAGASNDTMPCCVGKEAGHCDSGIAAKKVPPRSEPMCGLDGITIVAEPSYTETTSNAAESNSVSKPCQMECGACASASSRQQKRERGIVEVKGRHTPPSSSISRHEDLPRVFASNEDWSRTNPRGPPTI